MGPSRTIQDMVGVNTASSWKMTRREVRIKPLIRETDHRGQECAPYMESARRNVVLSWSNAPEGICDAYLW